MRYAWILLAVGSVLGSAPAASPESVVFFEKKVRPVLAEHCFSCHGPKKQMAGLRLDTAEGVKKGTDDGPVMTPGDPAKSRFVASVKRSGDYPMPPNKPLPAEAVTALTEWVRLGAHFPDDSATQTNPVPKPADHWAFKPIADPKVPATKADLGSANPIDRFIQAKLEAKGLTLAPSADKRTLIRRVYFDLIGLPPTVAEVEAFEKDTAPDAFARLVDRLLASPHYGERWGRHWLDLARYSDSKGYVFTEKRTYPYAYTYRDYVIRAFNEDKPYNEFIIEQIAADRLPQREDNEHLAAMGFLTVGRRFMNNVHDIIDDRIDVTFRTFMGLTVGCARCHDHKYDPIPINDYYSLYGVFASTTEPKDPPYLDPDDRSGARKKYEDEFARKQKAADDFAANMFATHLAKFRTADAVTAYLLAVRELRGKSSQDVERVATAKKLEPVLLAKWRDYLASDSRKTDPVFVAWFAAEKGLPAMRDLLKPGGKAAVNPVLADALRRATPNTISEVAEVYGDTLAEAFELVKKDAKSPAAQQQLAAVLAPGGNGPTDLKMGMGPDAADKFVPIPIKKQYRALRDAAELFKEHSPPRAMALFDNKSPMQPVVFLRGNPNSRGPQVPRQNLGFLEPNRQPFPKDTSGRLELAKAIASPSNPLTARVLVNRVWGHHFGQAMVRTPSDFGVRTELPTHPELLDWLAKRFIEDGWSMKKLHRRIVLSAAYQQVSDTPVSAAKVDPENRLLTHQNRQRLQFEPMRDAMLYAGGKLDATVYGRSVNLFTEPFPPRRAVYGFVDRQNLPGPFRVFDFPGPDQHSPQRFLTTVPQQALFLMNSPFVVEQAKAVAARPEVEKAKMPDDKVRAIYRAVLSRNPTTEEIELGKQFAAGVLPFNMNAYQLDTWELFAQVLLLSNEFAFVD